MANHRKSKKFDFSYFIESAEIYAAINTQETHARTAISRLYYASFHICLSFLRSQNLYRAVSSHSIHENVLRSLILSSHKTTSTHLEQLKKFRGQARLSK